MTAEEERWITNARLGDEQSFALLVDSYQKPVFNLCYRMLWNVGDAEDAAQESFLRAYNALHYYDPERSFLTWLLSIASHYCIDQIRRHRYQQVSLDDTPGQLIQDENPGPETQVWRREEQQQIQLLLQTLNPTDRAAVVLYYWYDYSYDEIASTLSISVSAVKSRMHRSRLQLAQNWQNRNDITIPEKRKSYEALLL